MKKKIRKNHKSKKIILNNFKEKISNQKEIPLEFSEIIDEHFWELVE